MMGANWRFHHCGMIVRDLDKTLDLYRSLGFEVTDGPRETPPKFPDNPMNSRVGWVRKDALLMEILQPLEGRWVNKEFVETIGDGINHLCFLVDDMATEHARMLKLGFPQIYGFNVPKGAFAYFDTRRAGGAIIELLQPPRSAT